MKWVGYLATIIFMQVAFLGISLQVFDRFPSRELGLVWKAIFADPNDPAKSTSEATPPPEIPSYEDLLKERLLASPEIARKIDELRAVRDAVALDQDRLESVRAELRQLQDAVEKDIEDKLDQVRQTGEQKLLELVTTMKPKQAKDVLLADPDEDRVLRLVIQMDPASAEKIFREFKQPDDQRRLNGWLDRLGQGDPEAARLRQMMEQTVAQPVS